jgi:ribosomal protein S14
LAHPFRGFGPRLAGSIALGLRQSRISWWQEHIAEAAHLMAARKQKERDTHKETDRQEGVMDKVYLSRACSQ